MKFIKPRAIKGVITAPPSKSAMQRAVFAASLAVDESVIRNPSNSADALAARRVIEALGATVRSESDAWYVRGGGTPRTHKIECGEAGVTFRIALSLCARFPDEFEVTGEGSLLRRPMPNIDQTFAALGVRCRLSSSQGYPPIYVQGPIRGGKAVVDGSLTSQFISGLLFALPLCRDDSELEVRNLVSAPYLKMTVDTLGNFGVHVDHSPDCSHFFIPGNQSYRACDVLIEGDWSGASVWLALAAIGGGIILEGLSQTSQQADIAMCEALRRAGAMVSQQGSELHVETAALKAFDFDATNCPDLFPALVVLAAGCTGRSVIRGARRLIAKESNRAQVLMEEGMKVGLDISWSDDRIEVVGKRPLGGSIDAHNDHRIAMAFAALGCLSEQGIAIRGSECVSKSYPNFFEELERMTGEATVWT